MSDTEPKGFLCPSCKKCACIEYSSRHPDYQSIGSDACLRWQGTSYPMCKCPNYEPRSDGKEPIWFAEGTEWSWNDFEKELTEYEQNKPAHITEHEITSHKVESVRAPISSPCLLCSSAWINLSESRYGQGQHIENIFCSHPYDDVIKPMLTCPHFTACPHK